MDMILSKKILKRHTERNNRWTLPTMRISNIYDFEIKGYQIEIVMSIPLP